MLMNARPACKPLLFASFLYQTLLFALFTKVLLCFHDSLL